MSRKNTNLTFFFLIFILIVGLVFSAIAYLKQFSRAPNLASSSVPQEPIFLVAGFAKKNYLASQTPSIRIKTKAPLEELKGRIIILDQKKKPVHLAFKIKEEGEEKIIAFLPTSGFQPGTYTLKITTDKKKDIQQDFSWGVLAINTDKSSYLPAEIAEIWMTVLDDTGKTVCDAQVFLTLVSPSGKKFEFSTQAQTIVKSDECQPKNVTYKPDFKASISLPEETGKYQLLLKSLIPNGQREIEDSLWVEKNPRFVVSRTGPTRIYPPSDYSMKIKIQAFENFSGIAKEIVPAGFMILNSQSISSEILNQQIQLSFPITLNSGEEISFSYTFRAPIVSPEFYLLGPIQFSLSSSGKPLFEEPRAWQLAADPVASGINVAWASTVTTIPANWSRNTDLDSNYLKSIDTTEDPGTLGGATTHTHTTVDHTHTQNSHTHTGSHGNGVGTTRLTGHGANVHRSIHTHTVTDSGTTATNQNASVTLDAASSDPPYYTVIWISSDGTTDIPNNALAFWNSATLPTGWALADGSGRPDLRNTFLKGAATGADGGSTGGSATHTHSNTAHNHTQNEHTHSVTLSNILSTAESKTPGTSAQGSHSHTASLTGTATNQTASIPIDTANGEPPYKKLMAIRNETGSSDLPTDIIAVWTGTIAELPVGWRLCDGTNSTPDMRTYFVKGANTSSELGDTGGNQGHSHTAQAHTHTQDGHTHSGNSSTTVSANASDTSRTGRTMIETHYHVVTLASQTATNQNTTVTVNNNSDTRPPFYEVAFVQWYNPTPTLTPTPTATPTPGETKFDGVKMEGVKINNLFNNLFIAFGIIIRQLSQIILASLSSIARVARASL